MSHEGVSVFGFRESPVGTVYEGIVDYCCAHADTMLLVVREPDEPSSPDLLRVMIGLSLYGSSVARSSEWPGTILYDDEAELHSFRVGPGLAEALKSLQDALFKWIHPSAPEDLIFLRQSGEPLLVTISHEADAYMCLTPRDRERIARDYAELSAALIEE